MKKITYFCNLIAFILLFSLMTPVPALAVSYVNVTADNVQLRDYGCRNTSVYVDGDWSAGTGVQSLVYMEIYTPGGDWIWSDYAYDATGSVNFLYPACAGEPTGWYRVEVTVTEFDSIGDSVVSTSTGYGEFKVTARTRKNSHVTLIKRHIHQGPWYALALGDLTIRNAPRSWDRRRPLNLWVFYSGSWYRVDTQVTGYHGRAGWKFRRQANQYVWDICFYGNGHIWGDCTGGFRVSRGVSGRVVPVPSPKMSMEGKSLPPALQGLVR